VNVFELIGLFGMIAAGLWCGAWLGPYYGTMGYVLGFTIGAGLVVGGLYVLGELLNKVFPYRPICREGRCSSKDYKTIEWKGSNPVCVCRCGHKYLTEGRRFLQVLDDASTRRYMIRCGFFGLWRQDKEEEEASKGQGSGL
jgi:hypothetical protein